MIEPMLSNYVEGIPDIVGQVADIDAIFDEYFAKGLSPGLVYGVTRGQEIIHSRALGVASLNGKLPTTRSTFRVASLVKSFSSAATLLLRDRGLISLEVPISTYLSELTELQPPFSDSPKINSRMLLTMSAGFPTDNEWADRLEGLSDSEFGEILKTGIRFNSRPGDRYEYSNLGYALLARIIARVTGKSFIEFVDEELIRPMELAKSTFDFRTSKDLAIGYVKRENWDQEIFTRPGAFSSIGGLITNLEDLAIWSGYLSEAFNSGAPERGPISKATRREMQHIQQVIPTIRESNSELSYTSVNGYGFGLRVEEDYDFGKIIGHSGGYPGYGSDIRWHPASGFGIIALTNGRYAGPVKACVPALKLLLSKNVQLQGDPSKESLDLQRDVNNLISKWDGGLADQIFGINMDLDHPRSFRIKKLNEAIERVGGVNTSGIFEVTSENASQLAWKLSGNRGNLLIKIWLTPNLPAKLQVWNVLPVDLLDT